MKKIVFLLAFGLAALFTQAQNPSKIGFADVEYIFSQMPEAKTIEAELQTLQTQLKKQYDGKVAEFQKKLQEYQQDSQENLQRKQVQLMEPIYTKVGKAIEDVAKENSFTMVLTNQISGLDVVLYSDTQSDISDMVLKKMGITPQAAVTTPPKN